MQIPKRPVQKAIQELAPEEKVELRDWLDAFDIGTLAGASLDATFGSLPDPENTDSQREALIAIVLEGARRLVELG